MASVKFAKDGKHNFVTAEDNKAACSRNGSSAADAQTDVGDKTLMYRKKTTSVLSISNN